MNNTEAFRRQVSRGGFTLAELLVVVGIIVVLLSLLLPALARARERARMIACGSNMRELGRAMQMYANDNNHFVPRDYADFGPGDRPDWMLLIGSYIDPTADWSPGREAALKDSRFFDCPSHPLVGEIPGCFVVNAFAFETAPRWRPDGPIRLTRIRNPAEVVWMAEASDRFGRLPDGRETIYLPITHDVWQPGHLPGRSAARMSDDRHGGRANLLYFDASLRGIGYGEFTLEMFDDGVRGGRNTKLPF